MTIRHLKTFIAVCEQGGVTKAAEFLHVAQPAISQTIAEIEKYYNVCLFERINQRLAITSIGKELLMQARETLRAFEDFETRANQLSLHPTMRIGASLTIGKLYIPRLVKSFKDNFPQLNVYVSIERTGSVKEKILNGELDLGLVEGKIFSPLLSSFVFSTDRLIAVCGNGYRAEKQMTVERLVSHALLLRECGSASREIFEMLLHEKGLFAAPVMESVSNQAIVSAVVADLGVAILPQGLVQASLQEKKLRVLEIENVDFERKYLLINRSGKKFSKVQQLAYDFCKATLPLFRSSF